jgi:hypothetical protein
MHKQHFALSFALVTALSSFALGDSTPDWLVGSFDQSQVSYDGKTVKAAVGAQGNVGPITGGSSFTSVKKDYVLTVKNFDDQGTPITQVAETHLNNWGSDGQNYSSTISDYNQGTQTLRNITVCAGEVTGKARGVLSSISSSAAGGKCVTASPNVCASANKNLRDLTKKLPKGSPLKSMNAEQMSAQGKACLDLLSLYGKATANAGSNAALYNDSNRMNDLDRETLAVHGTLLTGPKTITATREGLSDFSNMGPDLVNDANLMVHFMDACSRGKNQFTASSTSGGLNESPNR